MESKKKPNIVLYTISMIITFFVITELIIWGKGSDIIMDAVTNYPQGDLVISEVVLASLVLIVMLLFKNSYVFTQKQQKITKGLRYGLFYIIFPIILILLNLESLGRGIPVINLLIGCFFIGVTEEFLCRGWLLNEFLERFGDNKKGVWYSIIVSGIIFGLMHFANVLNGQDLFATIEQVLGAISTGIVFGLIYYKTKNIWSVIILHALWDFSIFLGNISIVTSTTETFNHLSIICLFIALIVELVNIIPYIKNIDAEPKTSVIVLLSLASISLFFVNNIFDNTSYGETYEYDSISIEKYAVKTDNYDEYYIKYSKTVEKNNIQLNENVENNVSPNENTIDKEENYSFKLEKNKDNNLILTNINTNYTIELECESLYDYIIMEDKDYYILAYVDYSGSSNPFLNYIYINKNDLSNDNQFMDNIKDNMKKYLLSSSAELLVVEDGENEKSYLGAYNSNYGYYLLTSEDKMSILNRD